MEGLTQTSHDYYLSKFFGGDFTNPNGCPVTASFYLCAWANDYTLVHDYYINGHEIGSESVTWNTDPAYWASLDTEGWSAEFGDMKKMAVHYGNVPEDEILGTRVPFFYTGGDSQFGMYEENGFMYDYSQTSKNYGYDNLANGAWPSSLDYFNTLDCEVAYCPLCSYEGIWNQPFLELEDLNYGSAGADLGGYCDILDSC